MITQDEAKQLRAGNYVTYHSDEGDMESRLIALDIYNIAEDRMGNCEAHSFIPLSEDLLLRLGFEKIKNKIDIFELARIRVWLGSSGQCLVYLIEEDTTKGHYMTKIEYVHHIQNIAYDFGREITLKP